MFACKANATVAVLPEVFGEGLGADVASQGELAAALRAVPTASIVVHGNNPSERDPARRIDAHAALIVVDHAGSSS